MADDENKNIQFVLEVEKHPCLYNTTLSRYSRKNDTDKAWAEIGKIMNMTVTDLMKKWRNLRDTFKRQLEAEKKIREGHDIKRKTYVYFKHMLFLLPHISSDTVSSDPAVEPQLDEYFTRNDAKRQAKVKRKTSDKPQTLKKKKCLEKQSVVNSIIFPEIASTSTNSIMFPELPSTSTNKEDLIDEDKHFLMSLVPSFKRMSDDEKLEAKVEILKVIKGIRKKNSENSECSPVVDSLSYNLEESDLNRVKVEMVTVEGDESDEMESESSENSN